MLFKGKIGFDVPTEVRPGVWLPDGCIERPYRGEIIRNTGHWDNSSDTTNDSLRISMTISIIANPFAKEHFGAMRYIIWKGVRLKIIDVDPINYPRVVLTIGGLYDGVDEETETP
jgi:hypothetical protein